MVVFVFVLFCFVVFVCFVFCFCFCFCRICSASSLVLPLAIYDCRRIIKNPSVTHKVKCMWAKMGGITRIQFGTTVTLRPEKLSH